MKTTNKSLAKILGPVLLLTASLSLPAVSVAAPADKGKAHKEQKVKQNPGKARGHVQQQRVQVQRQKVKVQKQKVQVQKQKVQQQRVRQQVVQQRVVQQRQVYRQPVYSQPVAQRRAVPNRRPWYGWERGRGSGAFVLDGTFVDQQYGCQLIREHSGRVIPIVGNGGGIRKGDHVRLTGRVDNSTVCGPAFRVTEVQTIWQNANHQGLIFDRRRDGDFDGSYLEEDEYRRQGRYPSEYRNGRRVPDGYRYDDRYDGDGRLISVDGRLGGDSDCPSLRATNGDLFGLDGDLRDWSYGENVRVVGFLDNARSDCGYNRTIAIREINER
ncbi:MAG TPA: hypothetical protein VJ725_34850 [Thermoanaerobaculia bacterium]|nr:hypothetical protein [Thermoanaerobaculia bacterium]